MNQSCTEAVAALTKNHGAYEKSVGLASQVRFAIATTGPLPRPSCPEFQTQPDPGQNLSKPMHGTAVLVGRVQGYITDGGVSCNALNCKKNEDEKDGNDEGWKR